jgi:hypothetical protein
MDQPTAGVPAPLALGRPGCSNPHGKLGTGYRSGTRRRRVLASEGRGSQSAAEGSGMVGAVRWIANVDTSTRSRVGRFLLLSAPSVMSR